MAHLVKVKVLEIRSSGILVKILKSGRDGFIRRRELSWDQRAGFIPSVPKVGQQLEAVLLFDRPQARYAYLSLCQRTNPWQDAEAKYVLGQVVQGEVVNVRNFGVFVQLEPGITAIIWPRDIPLLREQLSADVLSIRDQVQGVITSIDFKERKMGISLVQRLRELNIAPDARRAIQLDLFKDALSVNEIGNDTHSTRAVLDVNEGLSRRYHPPISRPEMLLVIDDNEADLQTICEHLKNKFKVDVDGVQTGREAQNKLREGSPYGLVVIDIKLRGEHGAKVAEELLDLRPDLAIIFTSADPLTEVEVTDVNGRTFPFAFKEPEEIAEWVDKCCSGYWEEIRVSGEDAYKGQGSFIRQLGMSALTRLSLPEVLQQMLAQLVQETQASQAVVLEVDSVNRLVSILADVPPLDENIRKHSLTRLYYSPVREVVESEEPIYETAVKQDRSSRLKYFFTLLVFKTYFGIPLTVPGMATRHALFLFSEHRQEFDEETLNRARLAVSFIQVALERALLLGYMRRYEQRYSHGQLLGSLVHEFTTKLDGLGTQSKRLSTLLQKANALTEAANQPEQRAKIVEIADKIHQAKEELEELVKAYSRMVRDDLEAVDVNTVVRKVQRQMITKAREASVEIYLETQLDLPLARTIQSRLEQIVTNLVLNAIQQIEEQSETMARIGREKDKNALLQHGLVIVQTRYNEAQVLYPIQIIVIDTGPGIHYHQQERIFLLDTSTRRTGHGLGLYISRNLAETMGGRLRLVDSLMFIGSAFVVEFPQS